MKRLCLKEQKAKRGVASLYIVVFATILFGVVTLSFIRIVLSEAGQSSDDDLSRSAYDSAMAGVEDAKTAVNRYYSCISGGGSYDYCSKSGALFRDNCEGDIGLARYLYDGYSGGEVVLQQNSVGNGADNSSDQAYTCVIIKDEVPDYRGTLTQDTRTKMIPIQIVGASNNTGHAISGIRFKWYSSLNQGEGTLLATANPSGDGKLVESPGTVPPTIQLTFIKMPQNATVGTMHSANSDENSIYSTMIFVPSDVISGTSIKEVSGSEIVKAGQVSKTNANDTHTTFSTVCSSTSPFACTAYFSNLNIGSTDTVFLVASLPYGDIMTDFAVELLDSSGNSINFKGVQVSVDSTGRTNQLVKRVETRLDPADLFFPYPQYELELSGSGDDTFVKNFWITQNCWYSQPRHSASGTCENNGGLGLSQPTP